MQRLNGISLFSGSGMLDRGTANALRRKGYDLHIIAYVEREPFAQEILLARMRDGLIDRAPIWRDVRTFPAASLAGYVDCVIGGFPCQDLSVAGKRAGLGEATRSGLFFEVRRIAVECGSPLIFLENVPGIGSAACVDADGGTRPAAAVVAEALAESGYLHPWLPLAAADVGASHGRERWWGIGIKDLADAGSDGLM